MNYKNKDTGVVFTLAELKEIWEQFGHECKYDTFEDMLSDMEETEEDAD